MQPFFRKRMMTCICALLVQRRALTDGASQGQVFVWMDPSLTPEQRAELLLAAMTLDEKIALVHGGRGR